MHISRRDFLKYCSLSALVLGLGPTDILKLNEALANPNAPTVLWLQGSGCTGCTISFLNRVSTTDPKTAADILVESINLVYHPNLAAVAGDSVVKIINNVYTAGNYVLAVEGGVPTAYGGNACRPWSLNGTETTFLSAVTQLASRASLILSIGNCAAWGGIPASGPNITGVKGVENATGKATINIPGCAPHPDWIVWAISQILLGKSILLDTYGRPAALFSESIHSMCPRKGTGEADTFGISGHCLKELGCRGPQTEANCPILKWNGGVNWCIGANAPCIGCTEPSFPGNSALYKHEGSK
jgi:hydrogenase small subunit